MNRNRQIDPDLPPLTISPRVETLFAASMALIGNDFQSDGDLLPQALAPLLRRRYAGKTKLDVVELGPRATTIVPYTLQHHMRHYFGIDYSPSCVAKQAELLEFQRIPKATARLGNTYDLDLPDSSQDLVIASCHDPLYSGSPKQLSRAFREVFRILRDDGELVLTPWQEAGYTGPAPDQGCATFNPVVRSAAPFLQFRIVTMAFHPDRCAPPSFVLVLKKNLVAIDQVEQYDLYEEAEQMGRRLVDEWLETAGENDQQNRQAVEIWKTHGLKRTRFYSGPETQVCSWNSSIRVRAC